MAKTNTPWEWNQDCLGEWFRRNIALSNLLVQSSNLHTDKYV